MIQLNLIFDESKPLRRQIEQKYHHYSKWEDFKAGMWRKVSGSQLEIFLQKAIEFTGNASLYGSWMRRVIEEWPFACEQNLSDKAINRRAWLGHAACCLAIQCPEEMTRLAWHRLTPEQETLSEIEEKKEF